MSGDFDYGLTPDDEPRPIEYPEEWDDLDDLDDDPPWNAGYENSPDADFGDDECDDEPYVADDEENFHGGSPYDD